MEGQHGHHPLDASQCGGEVTGLWARTVAKSSAHAVDRPLLSEASLAFVSRSISEARSSEMARCISTHAKRERRNRPPRGRRTRRELRSVP